MDNTTQEAGHVYSTRQPWFNTSCCPTNYCRFLPRLGLFCANAAPESLRIDIPAAMTVSLPEYEVEIESRYPYDGKIIATIRRTAARSNYARSHMRYGRTAVFHPCRFFSWPKLDG